MKKKKLDLLLRLGQPAVYMGVYIYIYIGGFFFVCVCVWRAVGKAGIN